MATGLVKGEKFGEDALLAGSARSEPHDLPKTKEPISLSYSNKLSIKKILSDIDHDFSKVGKSGSVNNHKIVTPNSFILSDNYYGLKMLMDQYRGKITLIYLDPPYGTGLEFHSRTLKHAYKDVMGTAPWLEFMRRRFIIMRELLTINGSIYVHIGHKRLFHLKVVMDEVFGANKFRNLIVRKKCSSKNYTKKQYPNLHDYILFYTKTDSYVWNKPGLPASKEWINKEYNYRDDKGRYKLVPIHAPGNRNGETGKPWRGKSPPPGKHWQITPNRLDKLDEIGEIHWSRNGNPRRKVYLQENKQIPLTDYWDNYRDAHHQSIKITGYPTEKNIEMLKKIVMASSNPGDLVLDPFCGSGTFMQAANDANRKWFGIDQSFTAAESTLFRLRHGTKPMGDYVKKKSQAKTIDIFDTDFVSTEDIYSSEFSFIVDTEVLKKHSKEVELLASI